ncbi:MAG: serine hydrolase [Nocardiopsaceae bacterium]|jgi:D-alanyl-D-alanine carboxypeptidase (penicillin-binding protein 5/6)|nr:serine hydrolase [Nocardiopsaceae bacterium]
MHSAPLFRRRLNCRANLAAVVVTSAAALAVSLAAAAAPAAAGQRSPGTAGPQQAQRIFAQQSGPRNIAARAAELADASTTRQLWGRRQYTARPIASITKVMTALVVIKANRLDRRIKITAADVRYARDHNATNAGLHAGDILTARQLLYAMLLPSGADAAKALADSFGPGGQAFVKKMNATARALDLVKTHVANLDGLLSANVSTPRNLRRLGEAAMGKPVFRTVVKTRRYLLRAGPHHHRYLWQNTNLLLGKYPGVIGIKTGWTSAAGECLLFEATHNKRTLIGVVLHSAPTKSGVTFTDAIKMLNWGFGLNQPAVVPPRPAGVPME